MSTKQSEPHKSIARQPRLDRRGVIAILSMMFLVLFASLAAAMAIVSKGNLMTAQSQLRVNQALGAVDTGLGIAEARLRQVTNDFRVSIGDVDPIYAMQLWNGTFGASGGAVLDSQGDQQTSGVRNSLQTLHNADNTVQIALDYTTQSSWLATSPIVLDTSPDGQTTEAAQITYIPLPNVGGVRAIVTGYTWDWAGNRWISRTAQQDFRIFKRVAHAMQSSSKVMIGRNVQINGPLGASFTGVQNVGGHPIVVYSDFVGLDPQLDQKIADLYAAILTDDADGDNRLRVSHTVESASLDALNLQDYDGNGSSDDAFGDKTGDGAVDEFDVFLQHYDTNGDGRVVLSAALKAGTLNAQLPSEFEGVDDDLAYLIDAALPDRNGDGVVDGADTALGYRDGVADNKDRYAKIRGAITIRANRADWEAAQDGSGAVIGDYQKLVQGAMRPESGDAPITFDASPGVLPDIAIDTFDTANSALANDADGPPFEQQAGVPGSLFTLVINSDGVVTGQLYDASIPTTIEPTPYGGSGVADYYQRPIFQGITFKNVVLPMGLNALFINCTFVGVTRVEIYTNDTHQAWRFYGQQNSDLTLKYPPPPAQSDAQLDNDYFTGSIVKPSGFNVPRLTINGTPYITTKPLSNNIRFHDCVFIGSIVADRPTDYMHMRNKLQFTGATKFYTKNPDFPDDPALNPDEADLPEIAKSSMLLPHYSVDIGTNNAPASQDVNLGGLIIAGVLDVRGKATINGALLLTFNPTPNDPAMLQFGTPVGNPANFNATLGYFGPQQGDLEGFNLSSLVDLDGDGVLDIGWDADGDGYPDPGADPLTSTAVHFNGFGRIIINWDPNLIMPDGLTAPITIEPIAKSYHEGRLVAAGGP